MSYETKLNDEKDRHSNSMPVLSTKNYFNLPPHAYFLPEDFFVVVFLEPPFFPHLYAIIIYI
jgi:hypothetical protein